jgi:tetratricopeptide (TPR) repeat protein
MPQTSTDVDHRIFFVPPDRAIVCRAAPPDMVQRPRGRRLAAAFMAMLLLAAAGTAAARPQGDPALRADSLYRRALVRFAEPSRDSRQSALADLEEATRLAPNRADLWLAFGKAAFESGHFEKARSCFSRATRLLGDDPEAWFEIGQCWRRDWLMSLERSSLDEALRCFRRAGAAAPDRPACWSSVAALELLRGYPREALVAALQARRADPEAAGPMMMLGASFYRLGVLVLADTVFRAAREHLPASLIARFDGGPAFRPKPAAGGDSTSGSAWRAADSPWRGLDPDLTTPENEAYLDYLTRLAIALFLFRDGDTVRWDMRTELFLRYGPPGAVEYAPAWAQLGEGNDLEYRASRRIEGEGGKWSKLGRNLPAPMGYPFNLQVWYYPDLGMDVSLVDRSLAQDYELPPVSQGEADPRPDPALLAARADLVGLGAGRSVFRAMVPGVKPIPIATALSRFPVGGGVRLLAHVSTAGEPVDSLWGLWAVVDSSGRVVVRESHALGVSGCDPARRRVADFAVTVPAGDYRVDLVVGGVRGRRGVAHLAAHVGPPSPRLAMSDLLLLCGERPAASEPGVVRIEPDWSGKVSGRSTALVYYELENLTTRADGTSRFAYTYTLRPTVTDEQSGAPESLLEATREEENVGAHRRQFVRVPVASVAAGRYELRIVVRDLESGATVERAVPIVKE